jgi:hypothetical protein
MGIFIVFQVSLEGLFGYFISVLEYICGPCVNAAFFAVQDDDFNLDIADIIPSLS